jgi:hypothetical protein
MVVDEFVRIQLEQVLTVQVWQMVKHNSTDLCVDFSTETGGFLHGHLSAFRHSAVQVVQGRRIDPIATHVENGHRHTLQDAGGKGVIMDTARAKHLLQIPIDRMQRQYVMALRRKCR